MKEDLEVALEQGHADLAVHSLKDVPMELPEGFEIGLCHGAGGRAMPGFPAAALSLSEVPEGGVVGTSSLRRVALLRALRPDLRFEPLRGNLDDTRLKKLDSGQYDGIVLAAAGLQRLGLASRIRTTFSIDEMLPAAGPRAPWALKSAKGGPMSSRHSSPWPMRRPGGQYPPSARSAA